MSASEKSSRLPRMMQRMMASKSGGASEVAVGIDLGTTNSCVAVVVQGVAEIIRDEQGQRTTPSCVSFTEAGMLVGSSAYEQLTSNPKNTICGSKRFIGKDFNDPVVKWDTQYYPYKVVNGNGHPMIEIELFGKKKELLTPEEIAANVLMKMKGIAENYLKHPVHNAVITVPANFTDSQRQATMDAAKIAGLNILHLLNEPTAAAIAYGIQNKPQKGNLNVLVFDLGGGTFDVSILTIKGKEFEVRATVGNSHLGGDDFDNILADHFASDFLKMHKKDLYKERGALLRLRKQCERAKCTLSSCNRANVELNVGDIEYCGSVTREEFETLCATKFQFTMDLVTSALSDAKLTKDEIDDVVLVGGSTRIPKIQELLSTLFGSKPLMQTINPDEAVAYGAAVQAGILANKKQLLGSEIRLKDVIAMSLGVETVGHNMSNVIARNTHIPVKATKDFTTVYDDQVTVDFKVFQGESDNAANNTFLGGFALTDLPPQPKGVPIFAVTFSVDVDGILTVSAKDKRTGQHKAIMLTTIVGRLRREEFESIKRKNDMEMDRTRAINDFENSAYKMTDELKGLVKDLKIHPVDCEHFKGRCDQVTKLFTDGYHEEANMKKMELEKEYRQLVGPADK